MAERLTHYTGRHLPGTAERDHKKNPLPQEEEHRERGATPRSLFFLKCYGVYGELLILFGILGILVAVEFLDRTRSALCAFFALAFLLPPYYS